VFDIPINFMTWFVLLAEVILGKLELVDLWEQEREYLDNLASRKQFIPVTQRERPSQFQPRAFCPSRTQPEPEVMNDLDIDLEEDFGLFPREETTVNSMDNVEVEVELEEEDVVSDNEINHSSRYFGNNINIHNDDSFPNENYDGQDEQGERTKKHCGNPNSSPLDSSSDLDAIINDMDIPDFSNPSPCTNLNNEGHAQQLDSVESRPESQELFPVQEQERQVNPISNSTNEVEIENSTSNNTNAGVDESDVSFSQTLRQKRRLTAHERFQRFKKTKVDD